MINILKLHFYYLFSWKIIYISLITLLISIFCFLFFSSFYLDYDLLIYSKLYYREEYYFDIINYLKIAIVLYSMFLVINAFVLNKYDVFILIRRSKKITVISKLLTILIGNIVMITLLFILFLIIGEFLTPIMAISYKDISILIDLMIFCSVYLLLFTLAYQYSKIIYGILIIFIGYFISDITTEYYALKSSVSIFAKVLNFIFINIGYFQNYGFSLYYGKLYGIALSFILFMIIITKYLRTDLEN